MIWYTVALIGFSLFAGVGIKWLVDRFLPGGGRDLERLTAENLRLMLGLLKSDMARPRHAYSRDDTLDVLADGVEAGKRAREPWISQVGGGQPGVAQPGGGWMNGPMLEPEYQGKLQGALYEPNGDGVWPGTAGGLS